MFASIVATHQPLALAATGTSTAPPALAKDAIRSASGLLMKVLIRGTGKAHPRLNDCVKLSFIAWSSDGNVYARSPADGSPNTECVRRLTVGVAEAVRAMVIGEQRRVWVPARLNTFADDDGHAEQPASDLTYDLGLVEVIAAPPTPKPLKVPDPQAQRLGPA